MRPSVLHLAYEDPAAPGSGGGSTRTFEINRRLADHFDVHAVCAAFPGCGPRVEDGVIYEHVGPRRGGRFAGQLGYFARLPAVVRARQDQFDLIVEDFGAPFGSVAVPRFTSKPVLGIVQWLYAKEKAAQYHLPFHLVENFGLAAHRRLIAVSPGIAEVIGARNPQAQIDIVLNGLPDSALTSPPQAARRSDLLFLGRLDVKHKGLDLLLEAFAGVQHGLVQRLDIAGDGPGESWLRAQIDRWGLTGRVRLIGRIPEADRFQALAGYDAVVMPSRYESFGMVAAEAASVGTPVVAFDIPCLRDLVPGELLVAPYDTAAYGRVLAALCADAAQRRRLGRTLPAAVRHLSWDALAMQQAAVYRDVIAAQPASAAVSHDR